VISALLFVAALSAVDDPAPVAPPPLIRNPAPPIVVTPVAPPIVYVPRPLPPAKYAPPSASAKPWTPQSVGGLVSLFSTDDYPSSAVRAGEEGTTGVRLMIGTDGRVGGCDVISSSGSAALDAATCNILRRRARFRPALDAEGRPTIDYYTQRVRWVLPRIEVRDEYGRVSFPLDPASKEPDCIFELNINLDLTCESIGPIREEALAAPNLPKTGTLVLERGQRVGKGQELRQLGIGRGLERREFVAVTLTIGADGLVKSCVPAFANLDAAAVQEHCQELQTDKYEELPDASSDKLRFLTDYRLAYLRK
jgi:TonB family protein